MAAGGKIGDSSFFGLGVPTFSAKGGLRQRSCRRLQMPPVRPSVDFKAFSWPISRIGLRPRQPRHHSLNHVPHTIAAMMPAHIAPPMCGERGASQTQMTPAR